MYALTLRVAEHGNSVWRRTVMGVILAPIQAGKLDTWKKWVAEINGPRKAEWADFNKRYGLTTYDAWLTETPMGPAVIAIHSGPGERYVHAKAGGVHQRVRQVVRRQNQGDPWTRCVRAAARSHASEVPRRSVSRVPSAAVAHPVSRRWPWLPRFIPVFPHQRGGVAS